MTEATSSNPKLLDLSKREASSVPTIATSSKPRLLDLRKPEGVDSGRPLYETLPSFQVRREIEAGRLRWSEDDLASDFLFYLRCNHELVGLFAVPDAHPTDRPTRFVLLAFSFAFGLLFEVAIQETMKDDTDAWIVGLVLGVFQSFIFFFLETFFTCSCIRAKMDEDEQDRVERLEKGEEKAALTKDERYVREWAFISARLFGGMTGCLCFGPGACVCFFVAVLLMSNIRNISFVDSIGVTSMIWAYGYISATFYSLLWCALIFSYHVYYNEVAFKPTTK